MSTETISIDEAVQRQAKTVLDIQHKMHLMFEDLIAASRRLGELQEMQRRSKTP